MKPIIFLKPVFKEMIWGDDLIANEEFIASAV